MKMLLICPHFRDIEYGITEDFKNMGVDVDPIYFYVGFDPKNYVQRLKSKMGLNIGPYLESEKEKLNERIVIEYDSYKPDIVYIIEGRWITERTVEYIRKNSYVALYLWDMVNLFPEMWSTFHSYNVIYSFDQADTLRLKKQGYNAKFKPSGYDDTRYYPKDEDKVFDISLVGAMYPERVEILNTLIAQFPNVKWGIYGEYAPKRKPLKYLKWRTSNTHKYFLNKNITKDQANDVYNKSKIVLSIVRSNQENGWSSRLTEILGSGAFQLTNSYEIVDKTFKNCLATYKNILDLIEKIEYYLTHDDERTIIAQRGLHVAQSFYTDSIINKMILDDYHLWEKNNRQLREE